MPTLTRFSPRHVWAKALSDGSYEIGITDFAQAQLGDIVYVEPPKIGSKCRADDPCGLVESVKTASDIHAPLSGVVTANNSVLQNTPEKLNDHPYETWIFRIRPDDLRELDGLLTQSDYESNLN